MSIERKTSAVVTALAEPDLRDIELPAVLAALADPVRLGIVSELRARTEVQCGTFDVGVARSTLSHHLKVLRESGITHTRVEGVERYVVLRDDDLDARFPGLLEAVLASAASKRGRRGADARRRGKG